MGLRLPGGRLHFHSGRRGKRQPDEILLGMDQVFLSDAGKYRRFQVEARAVNPSAAEDNLSPSFRASLI